jgi:hypothetical protein
MTKIGQTPGPWLLAGGAGIFSADCVKALARAGFEPGDVGSYEHVTERIREAKRRVRECKPGAKPGDPGGPSPHDALLAQSTNGHLQQNAIFQRRRGNACENERPGKGGTPAGALCYDLQTAPCAPLPKGTESANRGTSHWASAAGESAVADRLGVGAPVSSRQSTNQAKNTIRLVAKGPTRSDVKGLDEDARRRRSEERDARAASAGEFKGKKAGKVDADQEGKKAAVDEDSAEKCIESWMKLANEAMRRKVMQDYSEENYAKTEQALKDKKADAEKRLDKAYKDIAKARKDGDEAGVKAAVQEMSWARQDKKEAEMALTSAPCLKDQVGKLQAQMGQNGGAIPPMTGSVPGRGRDTYGGKEGNKTTAK